MSIDVATLVFEFKSDSAGQAEAAMDRLIAKGDQLDATARKVRTATDHVNQGHKTATGSIDRAASATAAAEREMARAARTAEVWARRIENMEKSLSPAAAVTNTLAQRVRDLDKALAVGAISAQRHATLTSQVNAAAAAGSAALNKHAGSAKLAAHEVANLGAQLTDVFVSLASGQKPWMVAIQQGSQIGAVMGTASARGVTFAGALRGVAAAGWAMIAPFAPFIALATAAAAVIGGGFLLGTRNAVKATGDLTKGLGLTADQLDKVKHKTVTTGDVFMATFTVLGRHIKDGPIGSALEAIATKWGQLLDGITKGAIAAAAGVAAAFQASGAALKGGNFMDELRKNYGANVKGLNGIFGEITAEAAARRSKQIKKEAGHGAAAPRDQTDERMAQVASAIAQAKQDELQATLELTKDIQARLEIERGIAQAALAEKQAQIDRQIANVQDDKGLTAAKKAELVAQYKIVQGINDRVANLKDQALQNQAQIAMNDRDMADRQKIAAYYDQIASIAAGMATTVQQQNRIEADALAARQRVEREDLERAQQNALLAAAADAAETSRLKSTQAAERAAQMDLQQVQRAAQQREARLRIASQQNDLANAALQAQIDMLQADASLSRSATERARYDLQILPLAQLLLRHKLEQVANNADLNEADREQARIALKAVAHQQTIETKLARRAASLAKLNDAANAAGGLEYLIDSVRRGDIGGALGGLGDAASGLNGLLKGGADSLLGKAGAFLGPIGQVVGPIVGILGSIFSSNKVIGTVRLDAKEQQALQGVGSVLGSVNEQSKSISSSLATAEKYQNADLQFASQQVDQLKAISAGISALTGTIGREFSLSGALDKSGLGLGQTASKGLLGVIGAKSVSKELVDQGVDLGSGSLADYIQQSIDARFYQSIKTVTTKSGFIGIGGGTKTVNSDLYSAVGDALLGQVGTILASIRDSVQQSAATIGYDAATAVLDAFQVNIGRVSFEGMNASEISEALNAVFSKVGDEMAAAGVPALTELQKAGEGAFETLQRLATEFTTVDASLRSIGLTVEQIAAISLASRDALVQAAGGLDTFTAQASFFADNFLTEAERLAPVQKAVTAELERLGLTGVATRDQFKAAVLGLDLSTQAGQDLYTAMMKLAPAFAKVTDEAAAMADNFMTAERDAAALRIGAYLEGENRFRMAGINYRNSQTGPAHDGDPLLYIGRFLKKDANGQWDMNTFNAGGYNYEAAKEGIGKLAEEIGRLSADALNLTDAMQQMGDVMGKMAGLTTLVGTDDWQQWGGNGVAGIMGIRFRIGALVQEFVEAGPAMTRTADEIRDFVNAMDGARGDMDRVVAEAGISSLRYYFEQISNISDAVTEADPKLKAFEDTLGRLASLEGVLTYSADAAQYLGPRGEITDARLIASAAAIAQQVLKSNPDGDAASFYTSFARNNADLVRGDVTGNAFIDALQKSIYAFTGLDKQVEAATKQFEDMRLQAAAFRDELLVNAATSPLGAAGRFRAAQNQYEGLFSTVLGGNTAAFGDFRSATTAMLAAADATFATDFESRRLRARTIGEVDQVATLPTPRDPQIEAVDQLRQVNRSLDELRAELNAFRSESKTIGEQGVINTGATKRSLADIQVNGIPAAVDG